jgi:hypothetical protein
MTLQFSLAMLVSKETNKKTWFHSHQ